MGFWGESIYFKNTFNMKTIDDLEKKVTPSKDGRWRVSLSERLWVLSRSLSKHKKTKYVGVMESIERSLYRLDGQNGRWVRYENRFYPLHSEQEFSELLANASTEELYFFNNELAPCDKPEAHTAIASFIYIDEAGPFAWLLI